MRHPQVIPLLAALFWVWAGTDSHACSCITPSVCVAADRAAAVFVGRVVSAGSTLRVDVEHAFKGVSRGELTLFNGPGNCGLNFAVGERYLVYAYRESGGDFVTNMCSRTRRIGNPAAAADVRVLGLRSKGRFPAGLLTGSVADGTRHLDEQPWVPRGLAGIRVTVESADGKRRTTSTRPDGSYHVTGVPPGPFTVRADLPHRFEPAPAVPGTMPSTSCSEIGISAFIDGRITGRLLDERGRPARGVEVHAVDPARARTAEGFVPALTATTDEEGGFELRRVAPGRYLLGVDLQMPVRAGKLDRRRFVGETQDPAAATVVELATAEHRELPPLRLPALPTERTMTIVVHAPDPGVAAGTHLFLTGATRAPVPRSAGALTLPLPFGAAYRLEAVAPDGYRVEPSVVRIERDDTGRTVEFTVRKR